MDLAETESNLKLTSLDAYFSLDATYRDIADLAKIDPWVVYVGLGATIDRTNVNWKQLVESIVKRNSDSSLDDEAIRVWVETLGPTSSATTAEAMLQHKWNSGWVDALKMNIREILYGDRVLMAGSILDALSDWARAIASEGGSVLFITPNYDEYLYQELKGLSEWGLTLNKVQWIPTLKPDSYSLPENWKQPGVITCLHVHGFVPQALSGAKGTPALGEVTYQKTAPWTTKVLREAFKVGRVLVVGSSLVDGPLIDALIATKGAAIKAGRSRYALLPLQGIDWRDDEFAVKNPGVEALHKQRLDALGIHPIYPHTFGQVGQTLYEAAALAGSEISQADLQRPDNPIRYDARVNAWWEAWHSHSKVAGTQRFHHELLAAALPLLKRDMGASVREGIKVEVWARWDPVGKRELALWASTVGPWHDSNLMRRAPIGRSPQYMAVKVFRSGSPQFLVEPSDSPSRWRSYFGMPIWDYWGNAPFISGVAIMASTWPTRERPLHDHEANGTLGSVGEDNIRKVLTSGYRLREVADTILSAKVKPKARDSVLELFCKYDLELEDELLLLGLQRHSESGA